MLPLLTCVLLFYISLNEAAFKPFIKWVNVYTYDQIFDRCLCELRLLLEVDFPACQNYLILILAHHFSKFNIYSGLIPLIDLIETITKK